MLASLRGGARRARMLRTLATHARRPVLSASRAFKVGRHTAAWRSLHTSRCAAGTATFNLADIGEGIAEVEIQTWFVKEGDVVKKFDKLCEVESDKATVEITSRYAGKISKIYHPVGDMAKVGAPLVDIETDDASATTTAKQVARPTSTSQEASDKKVPEVVESARGAKALATPAVRRVAREHNVDIAKVPATGKGGRVLKGDILAFVGAIASPTPDIQPSFSRTPAASPAVGATPVFAPKEDISHPIRGYTRTMIRTMTEAMKIPHLGYCDEIDVGKLIEARTALKASAESHGTRLSFMPFMLKAASLALHEFPQLNGSLNEDLTEPILDELLHENFTHKGSHNIGVAMDTAAGLLVPNIKNVEQRSLVEIAVELNRLQEAGKAGSLGTDDLSGGTFTLSNIGTIGGTYASPVIVPPEVCIGAIGKIQKLPRFDEHGQVVAANVMNVSWSADHRVIDGASMARFSNAWKAYLEDPVTMLSHLR